MYTKQELVKLWGNDTKRSDFALNYKEWGIWFEQPELGLAFYRCDLPDDCRIIIMEYWRKPHYGEKAEGTNEYVLGKKFYLQTGECFDPSAVSEYVINNHLKTLKAKLIEELKKDACDNS